MFTQHAVYPAPLLELVAHAEAAAKAVPPAFPLHATVAVNPFLGQSDEPLPVTAARLARVAGVRIFPDRKIAAARITDGSISNDDLAAAVARYADGFAKLDIADIKAAAVAIPSTPQALPTVAELAAEASGIDWPAIISDRIGAWAGSHFDSGQAVWQPARRGTAYSAWREWAIRDLTPEILGLKGFGQFVSDSSRSPWRGLGRACETLGVDGDAAVSVFHRLLCDLGGWAQYARHLDWNAALNGNKDATTTELLALRLIYEEALFHLYEDQIADRWQETVAVHRTPVTPTVADIADAVLQDAVERAEQKRLATWFSAPKDADQTRPDVQAAFCIDVRSEVIRRALESVSPGIETLGFAGFFGLPVAHQPQASDIIDSSAPVLLSPTIQTRDDLPEAQDNALRFSKRAKRAWGRFKMAAVSSFAFVEAAGPLYAGKLVQSGLAKRVNRAAKPVPVFAGSVDAETRTNMAEQVLRAMSLTEGFAPLVLIAGHGASVTNNAHASALQCGACGGHAGDVNARLLAGLLNTPDVRKGLGARGLHIPADTVFVGALHDTTTDDVTLFEDGLPPSTAPALTRLRTQLAKASGIARAERAQRLPGATQGDDVLARAADWSQLRPEWGLAGCRAFIIGPRALSRNGSLDGQSFLHSYDRTSDDGFGVLETILTAPVVVASWISLQYYGSAVAPSLFGGGNKLLHNVTGGIGVVEGNGGSLRPGLPWQSVHDGTDLQHQPLRLTVIVAAPVEAITNIIEKHATLRALFDNGWLHLIAMDDAGRFTNRYDGALKWSRMDAGTNPSLAIAAE